MFEKLIIYLKELIAENDCIVLPDFGGFETEVVPAKIDKINNKIIPPSKKINFKEDYKKDNGIIANYIAQKENCTIQQAYDILKAFVNHIKNEINTKGFCNLPNIGTLKKIGDKIFFYQNNTDTFWFNSFGLPSVELDQTKDHNYNISNINIENKTHIKSKLSTEQIIEKNKNQKRSSFWTITVILLIIICICFIILLIQLKKITIPNEIIIGKKDTTSYSKFSSDKLNYSLSKPYNQIKTYDTLYYIVAGSYHYLKYAEELYQELIKKGLNPHIILTENKIYRVVVDTSFNKEQALKNLKLLQQKVAYHLWILPLYYNPQKIK